MEKDKKVIIGTTILIIILILSLIFVFSQRAKQAIPPATPLEVEEEKTEEEILESLRAPEDEEMTPEKEEEMRETLEQLSAPESQDMIPEEEAIEVLEGLKAPE